MARPRTPTNVLSMRGAFEKHPERKKERANEPVNLPPIGTCPERLGALVAEAWNDLIDVAPPGVLTKADSPAVEQAAILWAASRCGQLDTPGRGQLINLLSKFGMTPSDRSKVSAVKSEPTSKREKYLN